MKNVLMMGGPKDGVRVQVMENIFQISAPVIAELPCMVGMDEVSTAESLTYAEYFIHEFETDMGTLYLATQEQNHQAHDLMAMLVNGYRESGDAE